MSEVRVVFTTDVPPNESFARTVPEFLDGLGRIGIQMDPKVGGRVLQGGAEIGRVRAWEPGHRIQIAWWAPFGTEGEDRVLALEFAPAPNGSRVTLSIAPWGAFPPPGTEEMAEWAGAALLPAAVRALAPEAVGDWLTDQRARRPAGARAREVYRDPTYHWPNFLLILDRLRLTRADRLLEVGCGGGAFLARALESGCTAVGIDHSPEMVRLASETNRAAIAAGRAEVRQADAGRLPVPDSAFTCCVSTGAFGFFPDPAAALREMHRALRSGGRLIVFTTTAVLRGTPAAPEPIASRIHFYEPEELAGLARASGFVGVRAEQPDLEAYAREAHLPEEALALFRGGGGGSLLLTGRR